MKINSVSAARVLISVIALLTLAGPLHSLAQTADQPGPSLKVLYFHGNNRCTTCNNMEKFTRELLDEDYSDELKNGKVTFEVFNFDEEKNAELVNRYEVESSTLLIVKVRSGKEKVIDLTEIGFSYAKLEPEKFKEEVARKINDNLR